MSWASEVARVQDGVLREFKEDEPATVYPVDDPWTPIRLSGIFDEAHSAVLIGEAGDVIYSSENPVLGIRDRDHAAKRGDEVEVRCRRYRCVDVRPDGQGFSQMILERT